MAMNSFWMFVYLFIAYLSPAKSSIMLEKRRDLLLKTIERYKAEDPQLAVHVHSPIRTTKSGQFVDILKSETIRHGRGINLRNARDKLNSSTAIKDGNHEVYYDLGHADGSPLSGVRLQLKRNYKLVSQTYTVEEIARGRKIRKRHNLLEDCHYYGVIQNHKGYSKVAISLCNGLQGVIFKDEDMYFIEPSWIGNKSETELISTLFPFNETLADIASHPHLIIKRGTFKYLRYQRKKNEEIGHCGYSDNLHGKLPWWKVDPRDAAKTDASFKQKQLLSNVKQKKRSARKIHRFHKHKKSLRFGKEHLQVFDQHKWNIQNKDKRNFKINHARRKRSVSLERNVETLVVADKMLVGYHGREAVEKYILTIMNMVASLYHDASVGNSVNVVVSRIILLTEDQPDLYIEHHGEDTLKSFCEWQRRMNVNESDSNSGVAHHDNAVLLTGFDICTDRNEPCPTLGLAPVAGMCEPERSCNLNEDTGLSTAFTIAHEMGHNFGMQHDGDGNNCGSENGSPSQIMAGHLTKNASPFTWSRCSRAYITEFLESDWGNCLLNSPPLQDFVFPNEMPGQMYDADEQCRFQYGAQSRQCRIGDTCRELWCLGKTKRCVTNSGPAAEGTSCIANGILRGWCYRGNCVQYGFLPEGIDGRWGMWTPWTQCSRSCGGGASSSYRSCNNPTPQHGGKYCIGERIRHRMCNSQACLHSPKDFRSEQCQQFNDELYYGRYYNWLPFAGGDDVNPCALNCLAQGANFYTEKSSTVIDGTRCFTDSADICIGGECHHVGCDNVLHSDAVEDKCRVCGGDGSTCKTESAVYNEPFINGSLNYQDVVVIPRGSVNIFIEELELSRSNYIALRNLDNIGYINGGWTIDYPREFKIAGTTFIYERSLNEPEALRSLGPTDEDLVLMTFLQDENRGIRYEYNVPVEKNDSSSAESAFLWEHGDWTPCPVSCAGGTQSRTVVCKRVDDDTVVQQSYCDTNTKPVELEQACNEEACPPLWKSATWSECSRSCGGGYHTRSVLCMRKLSQHEDEVVDERYCPEDKPRTTGSCGMDICPPQWIPGSWSSCKPSCGVGRKSRTVSCMSSDRLHRYSNESMCDLLTKPSTSVQCSKRPCPPPRWQVWKWGSCSAKCGRGQKRRRVACVRPPGNHHSNECPLSSKPKSYQACESSCKQPNPNAGKSCIDDPNVNYCPLVKKFRFCNRAYFRTTCCHTCSK